jgi:hypothetical protein
MSCQRRRRAKGLIGFSLFLLLTGVSMWAPQGQRKLGPAPIAPAGTPTPGTLPEAGVGGVPASVDRR